MAAPGLRALVPAPAQAPRYQYISQRKALEEHAFGLYPDMTQDILDAHWKTIRKTVLDVADSDDKWVQEYQCDLGFHFYLFGHPMPRQVYFGGDDPRKDPRWQAERLAHLEAEKKKWKTPMEPLEKENRELKDKVAELQYEVIRLNDEMQQVRDIFNTLPDVDLE